MAVNIAKDPIAFAKESYDYIVVGAGTAGLALAARLSENPNVSVAVIEAGPDLSADPIVSSAGGWLATAYGADYAWGFTSTPQEHAAGQQMPLPRGKLIGGSSAINAMMWTRASKPEYDAIETLGNPGWNFESLLPYFKKTQCHSPQVNEILPGTDTLTEHQGSSGPIKTSFNTWYSSLIPPFVEAIQELSFSVNENPNGGNSVGFNNIARAVDGKNSTRQHSGVTYLAETKGRSNITVAVETRATKVVLAEGPNGFTATGVEVDIAGTRYVVKAKKEVILSAGAYQSPHLLELSGIGRKDILSKFGVDHKIELPVGENLQDHLMLFLNFALTPEALADLKVIPTSHARHEPGFDAQATATGGPFLFAPISSIAQSETVTQLAALLDSYIADQSITDLERLQFKIQRDWLTDPNTTVGEIEVMFANLPGLAGLPLPDGTITLWLPIAHLHPTSRGHTHLASADPLTAPAIDHKFLSRSYDLKALLHSVRFVQKIAKTGTLGKLVAGSVVPGPEIETDEQIEEWIKSNIAVEFHPLGTAAMAPKELGGVVDPNLKVYNTTNLRVVDASIIPLQLGCTPMATIYAIAEKAADIIKAAH